VSSCRSPSCGGEVIADSATDGHCVACGLHHRRREGTAPWARVIGPVVVTVLGSTDGDEQAIDADTLRFVGKYVTIDLTSGADRHLISVPARRLAHIVPRD
jgi:hypothetical protein